MKLTLSLIFCLIAVPLIEAQTHWKNPGQLAEKYKIDGSLSVSEVTDTLLLKRTINEPRYIIKKSEDFTYIAIRSNTSTILNAYVVSDEKIQVLHASAALGQIDLNKEGGRYKAEKTEFDWIFRDPNVWDEMHPEGVNTIDKFFGIYGWMANTWTFGSYREVEMLIDNRLISEDDRLLISYTSKEDGTRAVRFKEGTADASLTGDPAADKRIHDGYIPETIDLVNQ